MLERRRHRGYVLMMTLLLLALAAVALGAAASDSHRRALAAVRAQEDLQRRWGAVTCAEALVTHAAAASNVSQPSPTPSGIRTRGGAAVSLRLGDQRFIAVVSDEQAKVNVNTLAQRLSGARLESHLRRLLPRNADAAIRLSPSRLVVADGDGKPVERWKFHAYGQVFGDAPPAALMPGDRVGGLVDDLTCWGDGKLNIERASPTAVAGLCAAILEPEEFDRFRRAQQQSPGRPWLDVFAELALPAERAEAMQGLTTSASSCHSVWVVADADRRPRYRLAIVSSGGGDSDSGGVSVNVFEW